MIMISLLLLVFIIAMKVKEHNRIQRRQRLNARLNHIAILRSRFLRQDSVISYETAVRNPTSFMEVIFETDEFNLPSYDEALRIKSNVV